MQKRKTPPRPPPEGFLTIQREHYSAHRTWKFCLSLATWKRENSECQGFLKAHGISFSATIYHVISVVADCWKKWHCWIEWKLIALVQRAGWQHILYKLTPYLRKEATLYYSNRSRAYWAAIGLTTQDHLLIGAFAVRFLLQIIASFTREMLWQRIPKQVTRWSEQSYAYCFIGYRDRLIAIHWKASPLLISAPKGVSALKVEWQALGITSRLFSNDILFICTSHPKP